MSDAVRNIINLVEASGKKELVLEKLPYARTALTPVLSKSSIDYHYGELAKGYVDRFNNGEGDKKFNEAGAFLHNIFFPQLMAPKSGNKPSGISLSVINKKYSNFDGFKKEIKQEAMKIQGSGWIYMAKNGEIKTITNHQIKNDIALLIDWWEHAWAKDYGANKSKYLENIWKIINWDKVNARMY
jgi:Fe-Mn family superoxide dismutase